MEVKIGVQDSPREISLESAEAREDVMAQVTKALTEGGLLTLTDDRGRTIVVNAARITYVELGVATARRVGFGS